MRYPLIFIIAVLVLCGCATQKKHVSYYEGTSQVKEVGYHNMEEQKVGEWITYYDNGQVEWKKQYKDGESTRRVDRILRKRAGVY